VQHVSLMGGLGLSAGEAATVIQKLAPQLDTIALVVNDPAFPDLMTRIRMLNQLEASSGAASSGGSATPNAAKVGVGLRWGVKALDAAIFVRQNPWAAGIVGAGFVLFIASIGYAAGLRRAR